MTDEFTQNCAADLPEQLAAAAGAGELAAAAAIDAEEGDKFLHALLADQMAAAHLLTMRVAAAADRAITAAASGAGQRTNNLPLFDLAAARFAGAATRLNGRYGRGLQTLRALAAPAAETDDDIAWVGMDLPEWGKVVYGDGELSPEERTRRINREKSYRKLKRSQSEPEGEAALRRPLDPAEQAALAAAGGAARDLVAATGVEPLAAPSTAQQTKLFAHQLAASHRLMMRLSGRADAAVGAVADPLDRPEGLRLAHSAARLMERFRQGIALLRRVRTDPDGPRRTEHYWAGEYSDYDREVDREHDLAAGIDPDTGLLLPTKATRTNPAHPEGERTVRLLRRGRLNNGNPGGDFLAAPRCGARTRAGCACRQPAMANGRCRFHGGKSTGPRTAAGQARARSNRLVHGLRSAELIALAAAAAVTHRRLGALLAASARRRKHIGGSDPHETSHTLKQSNTQPPAGHGVDRSESNLATRTATILPFNRPNPVQPHCRNRLPRVRS